MKEEHKKNIEKMHFSCRKEPKCEEEKKTRQTAAVQCAAVQRGI